MSALRMVIPLADGIDEIGKVGIVALHLAANFFTSLPSLS